MVRLRDDIVSSPFLSRDDAKLECRTAIRCLRSEGFTVNRDTRVWTVYVIELDPKGSKDPGKGFVYVGETSKTPEDRYKEHLKGKRTAPRGKPRGIFAVRQLKHKIFRKPGFVALD